VLPCWRRFAAPLRIRKETARDLSNWNVIHQQTDQRVRSSVQPPSIERRSKVRFPLELQVHYRTIDQEPRSGVGRAVNLSSGGVLVASRHDLSVGERLELRVAWPSLLEDRIPLQLVTLGQVVRCQSSSFAVLFRWHQFRTVRSKVQSIDGSVPESPGKLPALDA
jgi:hypothetical protein